jgi:amino acid transporter
MTVSEGAAAAPATLEQFGYKQELKRSLGLLDLLIYGLVFIVPTAPFSVYGIVFNAGHGMVPLIYVVGLVAMLFTAFSYQSLSEAFPVAGSVYAYAARSIGPSVGFIAGWALLLDYLLLPTLALVAAAIAFNALVPEIPKPAWIVAMLAFNTIVNYLGIESTAKANFILLGIQAAVLIALMGMCVAGLVHGTGGAHLSLTPFFNAREFTPGLIFGALSLAVLSFLGFDAISTLSEEVKGGPKMVGRATILSLCLCAFVFIAQTWLVTLFALGRTSFPPGDATNDALYGIASLLGGAWLKFAVAIPGVALSSIACAMVGQAATARLLFGMARDGKLPRVLAHVHSDRKIPDYAVFFVAAVTLALGFFFADKFELITSLVSFGALAGFLLLHISVVAHFIVRTKSRNWLKHLVSPTIGFVIIGYVLWNAETNAKIAGSCWLAAGIVILLFLRLTGRAQTLPTEQNIA